MKRKKLLALLLILPLLCACGKTAASDETQKALDFRTDLMKAQGCTFQAQVTADYGQRVYTFALDCAYSPEGAALTVVEPEAIAGISASVSPDGARVTFDGAELDFGQLANGYVAPMALPWLLGDAWTGSYIDSAGTDGDFIRITYLHGYNQEQLTVDTWLDSNHIPIRSEISREGVRCLTADLTDFQFAK